MGHHNAKELSVAVKKSGAKKSAARKIVKKSIAKKSIAKKAVKKSTAKKSAVKKVAKKSTAKKATAKKASRARVSARTAVKKATSASQISVPAVPVGRVRTAAPTTVTTTPVAQKPIPAPVATKTQSGSSKVFFVLTVAIIILGLVVWSKSSSSIEIDSAAPAASQSPTASAEATASQSPTPEASATTEISSATSANPAPERFIGNFRNGGQTLLLTWRAPVGGEGITGYNVEVRPANGDWASVEVVGADVFSYELQKGSAESWSQFRVSAIYPDGQAQAKIFGFAGQWSK